MNSKAFQTNLICPECGNVFQIMRKISKPKEKFHRKKVYCYICQKETNHIEVRDLDRWLAEATFKGEESLKGEEKEVFQLVKKRKGYNDNR